MPHAADGYRGYLDAGGRVLLYLCLKNAGLLFSVFRRPVPCYIHHFFPRFPDTAVASAVERALIQRRVLIDRRSLSSSQQHSQPHTLLLYIATHLHPRLSARRKSPARKMPLPRCLIVCSGATHHRRKTTGDPSPSPQASKVGGRSPTDSHLTTPARSNFIQRSQIYQRSGYTWPSLQAVGCRGRCWGC